MVEEEYKNMAQNLSESEMTEKLIAKKLDYVSVNMDDFFLLTMAIICFFLQGGFAFLEAGSVRSKNTTNILLKNLLDVFIGGLSYWLCGYAFAFGKEGNAFIGYSSFALYDVDSSSFSFWFFQFVFAATAATIVSGSMAERCNLTAYFIYSFLITGFIYPVISHWAWSPQGWLGNSPYFHDFAGSSIVHMSGGVCALVGAYMLGPRIGCFVKGEPAGIPGHSVPLSALGGFILLFGFMAFNGGSQASISQAGDGATVSSAVVNTALSGSAGGMTSLFLRRSGFFSSTLSWSFLATLNGALTGMVAVCSGCDVLMPWGAIIVGAVGGGVYVLWHNLMLKLHIDDPLDAVAVHLGGGLWGIIATPFLMRGGIFWSESYEGAMTLGWNLASGVSVTLWSGGLCILMFGAMKYFGILRVSKDMELKGMDILKHNEPAYPLLAWDELVPTETSTATTAINLLDLMRHVHSSRSVIEKHDKVDQNEKKRKNTETKQEEESDDVSPDMNGTDNSGFIEDAFNIESEDTTEM